MSETNFEALAERLRAATELLEAIHTDHGLLAGLPEEDRLRLLKAAGQVARPDVHGRRQYVKAALRPRKEEKNQRAESLLSETGIRKLRRESVFTTPNVHPPAGFAQQERDEPEFRESVEPLN